MKHLLVALLAVWALSLQDGALAAPHPIKKSHAQIHKKKLHTHAHAKARTHPVRLSQRAFADDGAEPSLRSTAAFVLDPAAGRTLYAKNITAAQPIASITKLMTAMVVLDAKLDMSQEVTVSEDDIDGIKHTRSRLQIGTVLPREDLMRLALMASENRAAAALSRDYPGGRPAFVAAMNQKAADLGMHRTHFVDSTGLSSDNISTAEDLAKMVTAAYRYPLIQQFTTLTDYTVHVANGRMVTFRNTNGLVKSDQWQIDVSKTGYISEAGRCLVMQARIAAKPIIIVLLDSWGKYTRIADANRVKRWVENQFARSTSG